MSTALISLVVALSLGQSGRDHTLLDYVLGPNNIYARVGDSTNNAVRVNVVASDAGAGSTTFHASAFATTATTLTQIQAAPGSGLSLYVTDITMSSSAASTVTTDQQLLLKYGTGTNCGTGTTTVFAVFNPALGGVAKTFDTPIKLPANNALCFIAAAAGTKHISVQGYIAP